MSPLGRDAATGPFDETKLRSCLASCESALESGDAAVWDSLAALALALVFERSEARPTPLIGADHVLEDAPLNARIVVAAAMSSAESLRFGTCRLTVRAPIILSEEDALKALERPNGGSMETGHLVQLPLAYDAPTSFSLRWDPGADQAELCAVSEELEELQTIGLMDWVSELAAQGESLKSLKAASEPHWTTERRALRAVLRVIHRFDREPRWQR